MPVICIVLASVCYHQWRISPHSNSKVSKFAKNNRKTCPEYLDLNQQFKKQNEYMWKLLKSGAEGFFDDQPGCYIFVSKNEKTIESIMKKIIQVTVKCLNSTNNPILYKSSDLSISRYVQDHTKLVHDIKPKLEQNGFLVISDLNNVAKQVLPGFHSICDTYNPLVKKSIVFFTMIVPELSDFENGEYFESVT